MQLRFDLRASPSVPERVRLRAQRLAGRRLTLDGVVVIAASRFRSQERNRDGAVVQEAAVAFPVAQAAAVQVVAVVQPVEAAEDEAAAEQPVRSSPVRAVPSLRQVASPRRLRVVACCWPIGEPGTRSFRFCDAESMAGKPYCDSHAQLAYVKVRDRREDAA